MNPKYLKNSTLYTVFLAGIHKATVIASRVVNEEIQYKVKVGHFLHYTTEKECFDSDEEGKEYLKQKR